MSARRPSRRRGFTLVELVIAGVVAALLATATAGSLSSIIRARRAAEAREQAASRAELATARIARDLQSLARDPDLVHAHVALRPSSQGDADEILMLTRSLIRVRPAEDLQEGGLYEVQYRIEGEGLERGLWRRIDPAFDQVLDGGGIATRLAAGITGLRLEATDGSDWFADWNSDSDGMPHAVRITATATDDQGLAHSIARRVVAIDRVPLPAVDEEEEAQPAPENPESPAEQAPEAGNPAGVQPPGVRPGTGGGGVRPGTPRGGRPGGGQQGGPGNPRNGPGGGTPRPGGGSGGGGGR